MGRAGQEVVLRFTQALVAGDMSTCLDLVDDSLVFSEPESLPFGGDHHGKQGFLELLADVSRHYRMRLAAPVIAEAGDRVLVRMSGEITARSTGRRMPLDALDLYEVVGDRIVRVEVFYKDTAAVAALCAPDAE